MKAMILAAGMGTRLRPLTNTIPKALIDVGGVPMLEIVIRRLMKVGVTDLIINVHYLPGKIEEFLKAKSNFGIRIELSRETAELLDTGGGLKKVAKFFDDGWPFFLHNADVYSDIDLDLMYRTHVSKKVLATLSVSPRESSRCLLFDKEGMLCGWEDVAKKEKIWAPHPVADAERMAFNGIHVIAPEIFQMMTEDGIFSITKAYLRLASAGQKIHAFHSAGYYYRGVGEQSKLDDARAHAAANGLPI